MKKILLTILAVAAVLTSCKKDVFPERPSGKGILTFSLGCDESGYIEVKSSDTQVDMSNFNITVYKLEDEHGEASDWTKSWLYSEFPESVELAPGKFLITAVSPETRIVGWDAPKYYGEAEFTIVEDVVTPVEVVCALSNMKVSVKLTDNFIGELSEYVISVTGDYASGRQSLEWTQADFTEGNLSSKAGYFDVAPLTVKITGKRTIDGTSPIPVTYEIKDGQARDHHILNIDAVVTGTANVLSLSVSNEVNERDEDINFGGVPEVPVPDEDEDNSGEQLPEKPYMEWATNSAFSTVNIADVVAGNADADLVIYAAGGIKSLNVWVSENFQEIIDGLTGNDAEGNKLHCLDLVNDTTLKANLVTFGVTSLPMLEQVKDQTVVQFPLTDLVTLIRSTGFPEGDYVFTLELEDNSNQKYEVSLTFYNPAY